MTTNTMWIDDEPEVETMLTIDVVEATRLQTGKVPISAIKVSNRKRELGDITSLAQSIKDIGLLNPITIQPDGTLIAGYHRLEACKHNGWTEIDAIVVNLDDLKAELAEIDENLRRNELTALERGVHLDRRKELYECLHPETKQGIAQALGMNRALGHNVRSDSDLTFVEDTVKQSKLSKTVVKEDLKIGKELKPHIEALQSTPIARKKQELLQLARMPEEERLPVIAKVIDGAKTLKEAKAIVRQEERQQAYENTVVERDDCKVYHCGVADLHSHIAPESVDVIITDPPYPREYLSVYGDLAKFAAYALKPGGSVIVMIGQSYMLEITDRLREHLTYHWISCYFTPGPATQIWQRQVNCSFKPLLWFTKGEYAGTWMSDVFRSETRDKEHHEWGQSESGMAAIIARFTTAGQLICDPFVGGGATAVPAIQLRRRFVGCDINEDCVLHTKQRVSEAMAAS